MRAAPPDMISDYERAVCYYTLPRVTSPVSLALLVAYAVCLFEALGAMCIGVLFEHRTWTIAGTVAFVLLVVFGIVVFTLRGVLSEARRRRALDAASGVPDAPDAVVESGEEIPNPFHAHVLLRRPAGLPNAVHRVGHATDEPFAEIEPAASGRTWVLRGPAGDEWCTAKGQGGVPSFAFGAAIPRTLVLTRGGERIGQVRRTLGLRAPGALVRRDASPPAELRVSLDAVYAGERLVGRIYTLRGAAYLDVEAAHLCEGLVVYFALSA
jgi:hypothetical protein